MQPISAGEGGGGEETGANPHAGQGSRANTTPPNTPNSNPVKRNKGKTHDTEGSKTTNKTSKR
jgi:hypothetical protein